MIKLLFNLTVCNVWCFWTIPLFYTVKKESILNTGFKKIKLLKIWLDAIYSDAVKSIEIKKCGTVELK